MAAKPQLLYFGIPGRGESIRLLYKHAGVEFEDKTTPFEGWEENFKYNAEEIPLTVLPVLTTPCGVKICQTTAIVRYVAGELNLLGKSSVERALVDTTIVSNKELVDQMVIIAYKTQDETEKATKTEILDKQAKVVFAYFERLVKKSGGPFFTGKDITAADIFFLDTIHLLTAVIPTIKDLTDFPLLKNLYNKVADSPNIKKYLASQK